MQGKPSTETADPQVAAMQLIASFAHELRNAMGAASQILEALHDPTGHLNAQAELQRILEAMRRLALPHLPAEARAELEALAARAAKQTGFTESTVLLRDIVSRALSLSLQMLDFGAVGKVVKRQGTTDLQALAQRVLTELGLRLRNCQALIRLQIPAGLVVEINELHAYSILSNLMLNACDALADKEGEERRVTVTGEPTGAGAIRLIVADNGTGIPETVLQRLFTPFVTTKGAKGTGLGLSLVKNLSEAYGGHVDVETRQGVGTTFTITLPAATKGA
jgi:signal transduction histidine kinase